MKVASSLILGASIVVAAFLTTRRPPQETIVAERVVTQASTRKLDFSDLVLISDNTYLIVSDYKMPIHPGYRVSLATLTGEQMEHLPISVPDWKDPDGGPSDLEACCRVPGTDDEFLLAESGPFNGKFGRFFHVVLDQSDELVPRITVKAVIRVFDRQLDAKQRAYSGDQIEGIACIEQNGKLILVYGERGGETAQGIKTGTLVWGELDLANKQFNKLGESSICGSSVLSGRDCGSLQLTGPVDNRYTVIAVATNDPGEDGPFQSVIYQAGDFVLDTRDGPGFERLEDPKILATLSGLKVEGIAGPPVIAPESTFTISTDDEAFGAIIRPVRMQ